jgi:thioredoxin reductase (NADPH)
MQKPVHKLIIIGSGPAALTAGIYSARAALNPIIIEGLTPGGQLMSTTMVENWPGEKGILGPKLMLNMREHATHLGCTFISGEIVNVDFSKKPFKLTTSRQEDLFSHAVIIATGATAKKLNVPGEAKYWNKGVTVCAVCDGAFYKDMPVVIVGGGDTAMEDASFMTNFTNDITIIQISAQLSASEAMKARVLNNPTIKIMYNSTVTQIKGTGDAVNSIVITNNVTKAVQTIATRGVFIAIGLSPNTAPFAHHVKCSPSGYLELTDGTKTSVPGIFGAGDIADYRYRQAITSAGAGCMAALDAERYLKEQNL